MLYTDHEFRLLALFFASAMNPRGICYIIAFALGPNLSTVGVEVLSRFRITLGQDTGSTCTGASS